MDIKKELIIDDGIGNEDVYHLKCGEVIVSSNRNFLLCCSICHQNYKTFKKFMEHVTDSHSFTDFDQNFYANDDIIDPIESFCETEIDDDKLQYPINEGNCFQIEMEPPITNNYVDDENDDNNYDIKKIHNFVHIDISTDNINCDEEEEENFIKYDTTHPDYLLNILPPKIKSRNRNIDNNAKIYTCKMCEKSYPYSSSLSKHTRRAHGNEKLIKIDKIESYDCTKCDKKFTKQNQLTIHEQRKHIEVFKIYKCSACPPALRMAFKTKKELAEHGVKSHVNQNKFKCNFCFSGFNFKKDLMNHEQIAHIDQRPHRCTICLFAFKEKKHLIRHERKHTGEKPYSCDYCDEKFTRMDKKKAHHQKKHENLLQ